MEHLKDISMLTIIVILSAEKRFGSKSKITHSPEGVNPE